MELSDFLLTTKAEEEYKNRIIKLSPKHFSIGVGILVF